MKTFVSCLDKLESHLRKQYPEVTWVRGEIWNEGDVYKINYRILGPHIRKDVTVVWTNGKEPKLCEIQE